MEWEEIEEIILRKQEVEMELPEDVITYMLKKNPKIQNLIDTFDLELIF